MQNNFVSCLPYTRLYQNGAFEEKHDLVICEERIALFLNQKKILSTMSIPQDQDAHAVGFLLSEGVIENIKDILDIKVSESGLEVYIQANINEENLSHLYHEKTLTSGCCVGVTGNFEGKIIEKFVSSQVRISSQILWKILDRFYQENELFNQTGCVHKALLANHTGEILTQAFDVGRHNAIDKAIGKARLLHLNLKNALLFVSGRLSLEMIIKAAMHDIPVVISRAATTQLAIQAAQKMGITLIGFTRENRCNIYTHRSRIL